MKKDGSWINAEDTILQSRNYLISNIEKLIEESVYYRTYSSEIKEDTKVVLFNFHNDSGKGLIK